MHPIKKVLKKDLRSALLPLLLLLTSPVMAQGDLLVFPKRIVFDGTRTRSQTVNLSNTGRDTARYDISLVQIRMTETGGFENITEPDPGQSFADPYLRIFPRRVVLAPNESQTVKIQLTRTSELEAGEYRSHVYFRSVPDMKPLGEVPDEDVEATTVSIRLTPIYGITIPCIIQVGATDTQVSISNLSIEFMNYQTVLALAIGRTGNMSVFGEITVIHSSPGGKKTEVGKVNGLAVYTPGNVRRTLVGLKNMEGVDYRSGVLTVDYSTQEKGNKKVRLAEAELILQ